MNQSNIEPQTDDVLVRFAKYGKWEPLNSHVEFKDQTELIGNILNRYPEREFIQMKCGQTEAVIKRKK